MENEKSFFPLLPILSANLNKFFFVEANRHIVEAMVVGNERQDLQALTQNRFFFIKM